MRRGGAGGCLGDVAQAGPNLVTLLLPQHSGMEEEPGREKFWGVCLALPGVLEVLLVVVSVEHREAEQAASNLLSLLLQLGQVLLGIVCGGPGRAR